MNDERTRGGPKDREALSVKEHPVIDGVARAWRSLPNEEPDPSLLERVGDRVMSEISSPVADLDARRRLRGMISAGAVALAAAAAAALMLMGPESTPKVEPARAPAQKLAAEEERPPVLEENETNPPEPKFAGAAVAIEGRATLVRGGGMPSQLTTERRVALGDLFQLGPDAEVEISMPGAARFAMSPDTILKLGGGERTVVLDLKRGSVAVNVEPRGVGDGFFVTTPAGRVEVTGTIFEVEVSRTAAVKVEVAEGTVVVRDLADTRNVVKVKEGFGLSLDWSNPEPRRLDRETANRIIGRFQGKKPIDVSPQKPAQNGPERWEKMFDEAQQLRSSRRTAEALNVYREIAREAPSRQMKAEAWLAIAQVRYSTGDKAGAEQDLTAHSELFAGTPFEKLADSYLAKIRGAGQQDQ